MSNDIATQHDIDSINKFCQRVHRANAKWWVDIEQPCGVCLGTGMYLDQGAQNNYRICSSCKGLGSQVRVSRNVGEMLALVHSEISEALEGHRKDLMDDHLPHRKMFEVELADAVIRIFDIAAGLGLDLGGAFEEKMEYNARRRDHQLEARRLAGGKKY